MKFLLKYYAPGPDDYTGPSKDDIKNSDLLNQNFSDMRNNLRGISQELKSGISDQLVFMVGTSEKIVESIGRDLQAEIKSAAKTTEILNNKTKDIGKTLNTEAKIKDKIRENDARREKIIDLINEAQSEGVHLSGNMKKAADDLLITLQAQDKIMLEQLRIVKAKEESTAKYHQRLEKAFTTLSKIPILGGMMDVSKIMDKVKKTAEEGGSKLKQLGAGMKELGKQLADPFTLITVGITGAISLFKTLFTWALEFDQKVFDAAKSIGVSVGEAERLNGQFQAIAASGMNLGLQAKDLVKTYSEMNDQLGFMVPSSADFAGNMTLIQKRIGASAAEMEAISTAAAYSGQSVKSTYGTLIGTAKVEAARNGFMMTNKQILDSIAKTSKTVLMNFGGNVKELVKSIVQAKKLGTTLDEIQNRGNSMLDFESSISKEFEFQALTGKNIDLTKARQLAQTRDTKGLMAELNKQGLTFTEWNKLGNIEQQSYAEMMGTSVEKLNEQYNAQKQINALGAQEGESLAARYGILMKTAEGRKKIAESLSQEEQADLARASANEEWDATLQRIKDTLGSILRGPATEIVHTVTSWLNNTKLVQEFGMKVKGVFQGVAEFVKEIPGFLDKIPNILNKIITFAKAWFSISLGIAAANVAASMGATPLVGLAVGLAAAATMYAALSALVPDFSGGSAPAAAAQGGASVSMQQSAKPATKVQDGVAPAGKGPFTVMDSYGNLAVTSAGDGLAASPNINPMNANAAAARASSNSATSQVVNVPQGPKEIVIHNIFKANETTLASSTNRTTINTPFASADGSTAKGLGSGVGAPVAYSV